MCLSLQDTGGRIGTTQVQTSSSSSFHLLRQQEQLLCQSSAPYQVLCGSGRIVWFQEVPDNNFMFLFSGSMDTER